MSVRALVVGSFVLDLAFRVPRPPGPGDIVVAHAAGEYRGGKGYNQAVALARLGAAVTMVGALDTTGAGDAFSAALALALAEGAATPDAVRFACAAGAHAATVVGAEPSLPRRAEVEKLLAG